MDRHIANLMHQSDSRLTAIVNDNAGGTSLSDPRMTMRFHSSAPCPPPGYGTPTMDSYWRKDAATHPSRRSPKMMMKTSALRSRAGECRWDSEDRNSAPFQQSPSCPLRSPEHATPRRKISTRDLLMSLPVDVGSSGDRHQHDRNDVVRDPVSPASVAAIAGVAIGVVRLEDEGEGMGRGDAWNM